MQGEWNKKQPGMIVSFRLCDYLMQEELLVSVDVGGTISRRGSFEEKDEGVNIGHAELKSL